MNYSHSSIQFDTFYIQKKLTEKPTHICLSKHLTVNLMALRTWYRIAAGAARRGNHLFGTTHT